MGMDFTAYLGHNLDGNDIHRLCHALNADSLTYINQFVKEFVQYNREDLGIVWKVTPECIGGTIGISGPCGLDFTFSEKICYFHHYIRWRNFILEEEIQVMLRKVTFDLARYFNSSFAIYVPDNAAKESAILDFIWDDENKDINFIKDWLNLNSGKPKENIKDIYKDCGDYWESEGYYIDYFIDLK